MELQFYKEIEASTAHRPIRDRLCGDVLSDPALFPVLLAAALNCSNKNHYKACWVLELVLESNLQWLEGNCEEFTQALPHFKNESAIRSISKICMFAAEKHHKTNEKFLSARQLQLVTEACFDWLINNTKVASKAYAMRALYIMGKKHPWIHDELKQLLPLGYSQHSPAYKAAAKDILKKIG